MSLGVTLVAKADAERTLSERARDVNLAMIQSLRISAEKVYAEAVENVSGKVLNVRTGNLRRRIFTRVDEEALAAYVATNVKYGPVHEYGMTVQIPEIRPVKAKALRFRTPGFVGPLIITKRGKVSRRNRSGITFAKRVRAHQVRIPARPWLRPALSDSGPFIAATFQTNVAAAMRGESAPRT